MFTPPRYRLDDPQAAFDLIDDHGFCVLVTVTDPAPAISHLPMIADRARNILRGHLARANPHTALLDGRRHIAIFTGANAYVSPNWYRDRSRVPTWNYLTVHVEGVGRVIDAPEDVDALLAALSAHYESRRHDLAADEAWTMDKLPPEKLARLRRGIVAFEIAIDSVAAKAKLSQSDDEADRAGAIEALSSGDDMRRAIAKAMLSATRKSG
ncbi:MAG: FMN-binding negative transcriptional regulator [Pseudomonadota bacterium]